MNAHMITRNIVVEGRRTTIRLEAAVWEAFDELCVRERATRHDICTKIEKARVVTNRAQAVRATVMNYFRLSSKPGTKNDSIFDAALIEQGSIRR